MNNRWQYSPQRRPTQDGVSIYGKSTVPNAGVRAAATANLPAGAGPGFNEI